MSAAHVLLVAEPPDRLPFYRSILGDIAEVSPWRDPHVADESLQQCALVLVETDEGGLTAEVAVTAQRIRRNPRLRATPLLLIGARPDDAALETIGGPLDVLSTPVARADLHSRVRLFVDLQAARAQSLHMNERFLSILSHELRTPLNAILGWATLLQTGRVDAPTTLRALEAIERNARAQTDLIDHMQDVARTLAGTVRLKVTQIDPRQVVEAALAAVTPAANKRRIAVTAGLEPGVPPLQADPARLQEILVELLTNAITVTPEGGRVSIGLAQTGDEVQFTVADAGPGIPAELLPHLFDRFRQDEDKAGRRGSGSGLGLTLVRCLVELQHGTVEVSNRTPDPGAVFTVRIKTAGAV